MMSNNVEMFVLNYGGIYVILLITIHVWEDLI